METRTREHPMKQHARLVFIVLSTLLIPAIFLHYGWNMHMITLDMAQYGTVEPQFFEYRHLAVTMFHGFPLIGLMIFRRAMILTWGHERRQRAEDDAT